MQRIMIVGQPGSGKSTLARRLGARTGLPVVHIDQIHWQAGWIERPRAEKTRLCHAVEAQEAWIFEGGHSVTWPNRMARADLVIWLDIPVSLRFWRVFKRTLLHWGQNRPDLPEGCPEGFSRETLPFWRYIWRTRIIGRDNIARLIAKVPEGKPVVHLRGQGDIARFLNSLPQRLPMP
jgi:adenylate kinase family enzyme